jgi:hypothetical protein
LPDHHSKPEPGWLTKRREIRHDEAFCNSIRPYQGIGNKPIGTLPLPPAGNRPAQPDGNRVCLSTSTQTGSDDLSRKFKRFGRKVEEHLKKAGGSLQNIFTGRRTGDSPEIDPGQD